MRPAKVLDRFGRYRCRPDAAAAVVFAVTVEEYPVFAALRHQHLPLWGDDLNEAALIDQECPFNQDSPLLDRDLVPRLYTALSATGSRIAVAHDGNRLQPVFAVLESGLLDDLTRYLDGGGRKIDQWYERHGYASVDFSDVPESFSNINAPADKRMIEDKLAQRVQAGAKKSTTKESACHEQ